MLYKIIFRKFINCIGSPKYVINTATEAKPLKLQKLEDAVWESNITNEVLWINFVLAMNSLTSYTIAQMLKFYNPDKSATIREICDAAGIDIPRKNPPARDIRVPRKKQELLLSGIALDYREVPNAIEATIGNMHAFVSLRCLNWYGNIDSYEIAPLGEAFIDATLDNSENLAHLKKKLEREYDIRIFAAPDPRDRPTLRYSSRQIFYEKI